MINFTALKPLDFWDYVGATVHLPLGRIHGPRDSLAAVDRKHLYEMYVLVLELTRQLEKEARRKAGPAGRLN